MPRTLTEREHGLICMQIMKNRYYRISPVRSFQSCVDTKIIFGLGKALKLIRWK